MINFIKNLFASKELPSQKSEQSAHLGIFARNDSELALSDFLQNKTSKISANDATKISSVYACVSLLSQTIGTLPFALYERTPKGTQKAHSHELNRLVEIEPNEKMNAVTFLQSLVYNALLYGNAFVEPVRARSGKILELKLLKSKNVYINTDLERYEVTSDKGQMRVFKYKELVNVMFQPSENGVKGLTPISACQASLKLSNALDANANALFKNGAMPSGALEFPQQLSDEQYLKLSNAMNRDYNGNNAHATMILDAGAKFHPISMSNQDAQFLELKNFQVADIARIFRVPPNLIGDLSRATFDNAEQLKINFVDSTIRPFCECIEAAFNHRLLSPHEQSKFYFKFNLSGLLRGDVKTRFEAYNLGRNMGVYSANDIRKLEDMNEIERGDIYLQPLNMKDVKDDTK